MEKRRLIDIAVVQIERFDWKGLRCQGNPERVAEGLLELFRSTTSEEVESAYWKIENHAFVQGELYEVAECVTQVLISGLCQPRPPAVLEACLILLCEILNGQPIESENKVGNIYLSEKCKKVAREGIWVLYGIFAEQSHKTVNDILDVLEVDKERLMAIGRNV
jgi:hypothetical protein